MVLTGHTKNKTNILSPTMQVNEQNAFLDILQNMMQMLMS